MFEGKTLPNLTTTTELPAGRAPEVFFIIYISGLYSTEPITRAQEKSGDPQGLQEDFKFPPTLKHRERKCGCPGAAQEGRG